MTACTPAAIAASKGWSAPARGSAPTTGSAMCESTDVSPWPGKCFTHAATPADCRPSTHAAVWAATAPGSDPNDRTPMTGLEALLLTSASGARSRSTPARASSRPIARATERVRSRSPAAPSARLPG